MRHLAVLAVLICSAISAQPTAGIFLQESWYTFELVVFQHPVDESKNEGLEERPQTENACVRT